MGQQKTPYLIRERPSVLLGSCQDWALPHGFVAFCCEDDTGKCYVGVIAPHIWDNLMFEAKKVVPLLSGFEIEIILAIDGWLFGINAPELSAFLTALDYIIEHRLYQTGS